MKRAPCILTSEEFDMECCQSLSSLIMLSVPKSSVHWFCKRWPPSTNKTKAFFSDALGFFVHGIIQSSQGLLLLLRAWYDKALYLWKPRLFHSTAPLNVVAVSQSPWHCTGSVTALFAGQNLIFSTAKNRFCVVFSSSVAHWKPSLFRDLTQQHTSMSSSTGELVLSPSTLWGHRSFVVMWVLTLCQTAFWHLQQMIFQCLINSILRTQQRARAHTHTHTHTRTLTHWIHRLVDSHTHPLLLHPLVRTRSFSLRHTVEPTGKSPSLVTVLM